jgi:hypothetical protein
MPKIYVAFTRQAATSATRTEGAVLRERISSNRRGEGRDQCDAGRELEGAREARAERCEVVPVRAGRIP